MVVIKKLMSKKLFIGIVLALFFIFNLVVAFNGNMQFFDAKDEMYCHYKVIEQFYYEFPNLYLKDYLSTTTPLYHIIMAIICITFSLSKYVVRISGVILSTIGLYLTYRYLQAKRINYVKNGFIIACMSVSLYVIGPSTRASTDNLAFFLVIIALFLIDNDIKDKQKNHNIILGVIFSISSILTRQFYLWIAGVLFFRIFDQRLEKRTKLFCLIGSVFSAMSLLPFLVLWKGLTTPTYQVRYTNASLINLDVLTFIICLLGFFTLLFRITKYKEYISFLQVKRNSINVILLTCFGIVYLILNPLQIVNDPTIQGGWLLSVASRFPEVASTSIIFWGLFFIGLIEFLRIIELSIDSKKYVIISAFILWALCNSFSSILYQKYYEPLMLFFTGYYLDSDNEDNRISSFILPTIYIFLFLMIDIKRYLIY